MNKLLLSVSLLTLSSIASAYSDNMPVKDIPAGTQIELIDTVSLGGKKSILSKDIASRNYGYIKKNCSLIMKNSDRKVLVTHSVGDILPVISNTSNDDVIYKKKTGHYADFSVKVRLTDNVTRLEVQGSNNLKEIKCINRSMKYLKGNRVDFFSGVTVLELKEAFPSLNFIYPEVASDKL